MAALAHLGVGLAAKRIAPEIPVGYLILGSYAIDVLWFAFYFGGIHLHPKRDFMYPTVWTHSLPMATVWSVIAAVIAIRFLRSARAAVIFGLVVFSHWAVDFITHPMTAVMPQDQGVPLWFYGSPMIGLGMYRTLFGTYAGEFGALAPGIIIYILARMKFQSASVRTAQA